VCLPRAGLPRSQRGTPAILPGATQLSNSGGAWRETTIGGHAADVFEPARPHPHGFAIVYLHGVHSQRLADNAAFTDQFSRHGLRVVAPLTGPCWWVDRICPAFDAHVSPERHVLDRVLPWLQATWGAAPPRIALLGTSMGGQGALRLAFRYPARFPVSAAISPAIDFHRRIDEGDEVLAAMYADSEAARQDTAILHVHALNWPRHLWFACDPTDHRWHDGADRLRMKLSALGIAHACDLETSGGGHGFEYYNRMVPAAVDFLVERLEQERLRV
jgi:poly(3-hydroxybutyrate) depolymerase